ncbi:MAG: c-type cytochrome [Opitutus sp.]|nr:c-type cytochrome [Opitutus sp.]
MAPLCTSICSIGVAAAQPKELLPIEDPQQRASLPEYTEISAAKPEELTPANGWPAMESYATWHRSLGGPTSNRFSTLDQINPRNVKGLELAWVYKSGDGFNNVQCNPIVVGGVMYLPTAGRQIAALDAATGKERWKFAPPLGSPIGLVDNPARRGLMYWPGDAENRARLLFTCNYWVYALDPETGRPIETFGEGGRTPLPTGGTVGGAVYQNIYVVPGFDGDVFGYDVRNGTMLWRFNTIPPRGAFGSETWETRIKPTGANCWAGMALDESRGIAYVSTGSPKPNFSGLLHLGDNLFANCLIAINAKTGERLWHFQGVRHDIWDLDMGSPPNLVTVTLHGRKVDAVCQIDKNGTVYLVDRTTGKPLFPFRMRRAPTSRIPGEVTAPYQPSPELPQPVTKQVFDRSDISNLSPEATAFVEKQLTRAPLGFFSPPDYSRPTIINGLLGGTDWPGSAFDPRTGYLYAAATPTPWIITLRLDDDPPPASPPTAGERIYRQACIACHGENREGVGVAPPLIGLRHRLNDQQVTSLIRQGAPAMPPQPLTEAEIAPLLEFLMARDRGTAAAVEPLGAKRRAIPFNGYSRLLDHEGYPGSKPPWGTLNCLDLNTGRMVWSVPLGEHAELTKRGIPKTGTENLGGATVTAGNVVFVGGTKDYKFRAFDATNGSELWSADVPAYGASPPTVYAVNGRQFVVICASGGGHLRNTDQSDAWLAFALPAKAAPAAAATP